MRRALILVLICLVLVVAGAATVWAAPTTTTSSTTTPTTSVGSTTTEPEYVSLPVVISPTTVRPGGTINVQGDCGGAPYTDLVITPSSGSGVLVQQQVDLGPNGVTVQIPTTTAAGTYVLVVICEEEPDMQAGSELGPATFTVAGDPIATTPAATAVTASPTLTG